MVGVGGEEWKRVGGVEWREAVGFRTLVFDIVHKRGVARCGRQIRESFVCQFG